MAYLTGKTAFVTGSGRDLGGAVVPKLAAKGAHGIVGDLDNAPAEEVIETIKAAPGKVLSIAGSMTRG